ncbi:MAG: glycosyltransferase [Candidatus Limivivens sp.]|nr:glycosyltransferase [Candidatus Limivivens sp.]
MRVLILSCSTGGGHNAAGYAMKEQLEAAGHTATMLNYMDLAGKKVSRAVDNGYVNLVKKTPKAFGALYKAGILISSARHHSPVYYANAAMAKYLKEYLGEHPADFILMPHLYAAETLTYMKKHMEVPPTIGIATDYTCIPFWEETDCDAYILPHEDLIREYRDRGVAADKLYPCGIPVSMSFREAAGKDRPSLCRKLGLPEGDRIQLLMGGSMGFGKLQALARMVYEERKTDETLVVICGSNRRMKEALEEAFAGKEQIQIIGKTSQVAAYMTVSELVYTKPGGLTSTEAAAACCPMVHTDPIPGCETENRRFFMERGMAVSADTLEEQVRLGRELMDQKSLREDMRSAQARNVDAFASERILELMERMKTH